MKQSLVLVLCLLLLYCLLEAQSNNETSGSALMADSTRIVVSDSLYAQKADSLFYSGDNVMYHYADEQIYLSGNTAIRYGESTISSDSLQIDLKRDRAFSFGPTVLQDKDQILIGKQVFYDVNTQTGMMEDGLSKLEKGYYYGKSIRKVDKDIYDVDNGRFTTCDGVEPDFWFWASQLRLYRGDKIVGKPVIMYVNHFPVFYFPYLTFSIKRGRQRGFLVPEPGYNNFDGKFIRNIAYYYPIGDYADITAAFDIMEKTGFRSSLSSQYTRRYSYNGSFSTTYQRRFQSGTTNDDYNVRATHHHDLGDKSALDVNIDYVSSKRIWESSDDLNESLAQQVSSSVSYRKPLGNSYLNVASTYTQDLQNDRISLTLPTASYRMPGKPVYEIFIKSEEAPRDAWWTNFNANYFVQFAHTGMINANDYRFKDLLWSNRPDPSDTLGLAMLSLHNAGIRHNAGLSYNWKLRGWLNLSHGLNYQESWFDRDKNERSWVRGNYYSANSSANFNIYGLRNFESGRIKSIRHLLSPSLSYNYAPDFKDNADFYSFGGIGLPSGARSQTMSFALAQKWQLKYLDKDGKTEKKINELFSLSSSASLNLESKEKKLSALSHRFSFRPLEYSLGDLPIGNGGYTLGGLKLSYNTDISLTQDPYKVKFTDPYFRNYYMSQGLRISGSSQYNDYFPRAKNTLFNAFESADSLQARAEEALAAATESWNLGISHDLSAPRRLSDPISQNLRLDASLKLTTNWSLRYGNYYNLKTNELLSQSIDISRTLHCWKIDISYTRRNEYWDYRIVFFNTSLPDALRLQTRDSKRY